MTGAASESSRDSARAPRGSFLSSGGGGGSKSFSAGGAILRLGGGGGRRRLLSSWGGRVVDRAPPRSRRSSSNARSLSPNASCTSPRSRSAAYAAAFEELARTTRRACAPRRALASPAPRKSGDPAHHARATHARATAATFAARPRRRPACAAGAPCPPGAIEPRAESEARRARARPIRWRRRAPGNHRFLRERRAFDRERNEPRAWKELHRPAVRLGVERAKPRVGVRDRRFERAFDES